LREYDDAFKYLIDPFGSNLQKDTVKRQICKLCTETEVTNWDEIFKQVKSIVTDTIKVDKKDESKGNITSFSTHLLSLICQRINSLIDDINKDLELFFVELDLNGRSYLHLIALMRCWYELTKQNKEKLEKPISDLNSSKDSWKQYFCTTMMGDFDKQNKESAKTFFASVKETIYYKL
jgi:RNA processing factor Prp31